jgi:hypothetical protein
VKAKLFAYGALPYRVTAEVRSLGSDLLVILSGGDKPHIGSVAVAVPRPSLEDHRVMSSTSSVYNFLGHKDQVIAQRVAEVLSSRLNRQVVVVAGFHRERISGKGIEKVIENCGRLARKIAQGLSVDFTFSK